MFYLKMKGGKRKLQLKIGKMSSRELADWFCVSYNSYKNDIPKYLDLLESYCKYEKVYGGVMIEEIYIEEYDKSLNVLDQSLYVAEIERCVEEQEGLSTYSGMARKFKKEGLIPDNKTDKTYARRYAKVGNRMFGEFTGISSTGCLGTREYVWAVKISNYNQYRLMTPEEEARFDDIITTCYSTSADKIKKKELLEEALYQGEIEVDEYFETQERLGLRMFKDCIFKFKEETGLMVVRCQKHELLGESAF